MNSAQLHRIRTVLAQTQAGDCDAAQLADALRGNVRAMEGLPYDPLRQLEYLADASQQAAELEADGFESALPDLLKQLQQWLHAYEPSTPSL